MNLSVQNSMHEQNTETQRCYASGSRSSHLYRSNPAARFDPRLGVVAFSVSLANLSTFRSSCPFTASLLYLFCGETASVTSEQGILLTSAAEATEWMNKARQNAEEARFIWIESAGKGWCCVVLPSPRNLTLLLPRVEATPKTRYSAPDMRILSGKQRQKKHSLPSGKQIYSGTPSKRDWHIF